MPLMPDFTGLEALRNSCPQHTELNGPILRDGRMFVVNGRVSAACLRADGVQHGSFMSWYAGGAKAESGTFRDGIKHGEWQFFHENGQASGRGSFVMGKPEGVWITWHENGRKESEGTYLHGLQHGPFTHWDRSGSIERVLHFDHGKLILQEGEAH